VHHSKFAAQKAATGHEGPISAAPDLSVRARSTRNSGHKFKVLGSLLNDLVGEGEQPLRHFEA
jgi:hypothetical protein